jgi:tetratricopeptide (TPR) repeat protein
MFTKIFNKNYFVQTWMICIIVINGIEILVMGPGRADDFVLLQQPSTLEATGELIINGTLNEKGQQGSYTLSWREASAKEKSLTLATELNEKAIELYKQGKYDEAVPLLEQSLNIRQQVLGAEHPDVAESLNNLALLYSAQGRYTEAEPLYLQALEMWKKLLGAEHPDVASSLNNLAALYESQGRYTEAEPLFIQALEMYKKLLGAEHPFVPTSLNNLAGLYFSQGRYTEAEPLFIQALDMIKKLLGAEHPSVATSLNNLAFLYKTQGRYTEAEPLFIQALDMRKKLLGAEHPSVASSLNNLALLYKTQGRSTEAEPLFIQALDMIKKLLGAEHPFVASSLHNLASLYESQGRYTEAEPLFIQALDMIKKLLGSEHPSVASSLHNLAFLYFSQGRYTEAEPLFIQALEMDKKLLGSEHPSVASSLNNLALLYFSQGRYTEAEPLFIQALEMDKKLLGSEHPSVASSLNNLALLYFSQGRYTEAEPLFIQALEMGKKLLGSEHPDVASSLNNLAALYFSQGRYTEAEPLFIQALEMYKKLLGAEHPSVASSLNNLALLYFSQGRYTEAEPLFIQALDMRKKLLGAEHPDVASSLNNLAALYESQGRYTEAEPLFIQALEMYKKLLGAEHPDVASSLNNLALLYFSQGRYTEAEPLLIQALDMKKKLLGAEHPDVASSLNNLALLYKTQGNIASAVQYLKRGLEIQEKNLTYNLAAGAEPQKDKYLKTISGAKDLAISLHLQTAPNNPAATTLAFTTILRRKGRLLEFFTTSRQILRQQLDPQGLQWLDELNNIYSELSTLLYNPPKNLPLETYKENFAKLEQQAKLLEDKIGRRSSEFRAATQPVTLEAIQQLIPVNAALVEFVQYSPYDAKTNTWGEPRYGVYVLGAEGEPQGIDLGKVEEIESAITYFRFTLRDKKTPLKQLKNAAREVDKKLTQPLRQLLGSQKQILISPDGNLNLIPFEALVDENNHFLVENYSFTYLSSGRDLLTFTSTSRDTSPAVLLGDPKYDETGKVAIKPQRGFYDTSELPFQGLKGTGEEVKAIGKLLGVEPLLRAEATEAAVKQVKSPFILHIATHGLFETTTNPKDPTIDKDSLLRSSLVLAGVKEEKIDGDNGLLTALEATGLNLLGTELVVLSACDTGVGGISPGEGVYGLRRAFAIAGAQSQIISLWKVDDQGTKDLMVKYYQRLLDGNIGRTEALRQTQLEMLRGQAGEKYTHPYFWASFIPSGNWLPIPPRQK